MARKRKHTALRLPKPVPAQCNLRRMMPSAGMTYRSNEQLMHSLHREKCIADALEATGRRLSYENVAHAFTDMFRAAIPLVYTARAQGFSLWDVLPWVQRDIGWAQDLPTATFFELFTCLIEARHEWLKNPTPHRSHRGDDWLPQEIDTFRRNVGDCPKDVDSDGGDYVSWILLDAAFFNELAGGLDQEEEEEEEEDVKMQDAEDGDEFIPYTDGVIAEVVPPMKRMRIEKKDEA
ncbi:hypothetical protein F4801DRAFT_605665 [Xylaria longipes]|nr:hypothetical protein F4801DRAFT_605665 [Xylaria longipes]